MILKIIISLCLSNLSMFSFCESMYIAFSDSCSWLLGVKPEVVSGIVAHSPQDCALFSDYHGCKNKKIKN